MPSAPDSASTVGRLDGVRRRRPRLAILTSGGDAPGMNAVLLGAYEAALAAVARLTGVAHGFQGLAEQRTVALRRLDLLAAAGRAGTSLGTSRAIDLRVDGELDRCAAAVDALGIDGLIVVGGSGTLRGVQRLRARLAVPIAFVPGTIDNDIEDTDLTIGFDSAVNYALDAIDALRLTAVGLPGRAFLVEVLGGSSGNLARAVAQATPVDVVLAPESGIDYPSVARMVATATLRGYALIVMSEGVGEASDVARTIGTILGARIRVSVLGHSQRSARVSALDRALGLGSGRLAVRYLLDGADVDIRPAAASPRPVEPPELAAASDRAAG